MKKIIYAILGIMLFIGLTACKDREGVTPTPPPVGTIDDNGTTDVDTDKRVDVNLDPNFVDGLDYEYDGDWEHNKNYTKPGFFNTDGSIHVLPQANQRTGQKINVIMFGAKANDPTFDNRKAFDDAIKAASAGDEISVPEGRFYFSTNALASPYFAHISFNAKEKINFVGAGADKTILVSKYPESTNVDRTTATIIVMNSSDMVLSNFSVTAEIEEEFMPDPSNTNINNPEGNKFVPNSHVVVIGTDSSYPTKNVIVKNLKVSYFQYNGIILNRTQDCQVLDCEISDATDIGGGGAGYGIHLRGQGNSAFSLVGTNTDSRYNFVSGNKLTGPYMRHAVILSYVTHNNVIYNNEINGCQDEPLDLHGEDEFLNVITKNTVKGVAKAAIGLGNSGSTHDATGPGNVVYGNEIDDASGGIAISYGTPDTQIYNNTIKNLKDDSIGILLSFGPNTTVRNNVIDNIGGNGKGIVGYYSYVWDNPIAGLSKFDIQNNQIKNCQIGLQLLAYKEGTKIKNNVFTNVTTGFINEAKNFVVPEKSDFLTPVEGTIVYPIQEGNIERGAYESLVRPTGYFYFKGSHTEPGFNRAIFEEYELNSSDITNSQKVFLRITTTSKETKQHFFFWAAQDIEWDENEMTWSTAPYINNYTNNPALSPDPSKLYPFETYPYESKIYDPNDECIFIRDFECVVVDEAFQTYYIEITDFIKNGLTSTNFTLIMTNETMDGAYSSVRNMRGNPNNVWPCLIFVK